MIYYFEQSSVETTNFILNDYYKCLKTEILQLKFYQANLAYHKRKQFFFLSMIYHKILIKWISVSFLISLNSTISFDHWFENLTLLIIA